MDASTRERTFRAVIWLFIIGLLMAGGLYRRRNTTPPTPPPAAPADAYPNQTVLDTKPIGVPSTEVAERPTGSSVRVPGADGEEVVKLTYSVDGIMGTNAAVTFWNLDEARAQEAAMKVFAVFREVDKQFSTYKPDSELSRLNAAAFAAPVVCSDRMWALLDASRKAHTRSHGAFDVTAGPLMKMWGFYRKRQAMPSPEEIAAKTALVDLNTVVFDASARTVRFPKEGMSIDFGGIAKGYALDLAAAVLTSQDIHCALIDLGGNLYCMPEPPPGRETYSIGIRHPRQGGDHGAVAYIQVAGGRSIATSGDYERYVEIDGKRYSHIMDPRTGSPVRGVASVTVVASTGIASDMLSTAIFVNHGQYLDEMQRLYPGTDVLIIRTDDAGTLSLDPHGEIWKELKP